MADGLVLRNEQNILFSSPMPLVSPLDVERSTEQVAAFVDAGGSGEGTTARRPLPWTKWRGRYSLPDFAVVEVISRSVHTFHISLVVRARIHPRGVRSTVMARMVQRVLDVVRTRAHTRAHTREGLQTCVLQFQGGALLGIQESQ